MQSIGHHDKLAQLPSATDAAEELLRCARYIRNCLKQRVDPKPERVAEFESAIQEYAKASSKHHLPDNGLRLSEGSMLGCPDVARMGQFACSNRRQCWEPCGELGHDERYATTDAE